jgi:hypothetical protein
MSRKKKIKMRKYPCKETEIIWKGRQENIRNLGLIFRIVLDFKFQRERFD